MQHQVRPGVGHAMIEALLPQAVLRGEQNTIYLIASDSTGQTGVPSAILFSDTIFMDDFE